jgi:hypothetical protein
LKGGGKFAALCCAIFNSLILWLFYVEENDIKKKFMQKAVVQVTTALNLIEEVSR